MSIRKERFCDFMIEGKPDYLGKKPEPTEQCTNPASGTCFFCKRDYCSEHKTLMFDVVTLELKGFKQALTKVLPCCQKCKGELPYNPDAVVLKHFERCWRAIKRNIRAEIKSARKTAEAAREKQRAKAVAKAEKEQKAKEAVAKLEPKAEVAEAVAEVADAKPEADKEMATIEEQIDEVLSSLSPREQRVLQLRFGLEDGQGRTFEEVGKEFGVTRERIRQIEAKALRLLRHPSRSRKLKDYLDEEKPHDQWAPVDKLLRAIFGE